MASDATDRGSTASFSEEEAMGTYYSMERSHAQRGEELTNGTYRHNIRNSQKGYPKAGSSQSICKYPHSLPRSSGYSHTTARRTDIYQMRCTAYKVAPDDGLI